MITIFNRRELFVTLNMSQLNRVKDILSAHSIPFFTKTTNLQAAPFIGSSRARTGTLGINPDYSYEYRIYVHKLDYEKASHLIGI